MELHELVGCQGLRFLLSCHGAGKGGWGEGCVVTLEGDDGCH